MRKKANLNRKLKISLKGVFENWRLRLVGAVFFKEVLPRHRRFLFTEIFLKNFFQNGKKKIFLKKGFWGPPQNPQPLGAHWMGVAGGPCFCILFLHLKKFFFNLLSFILRRTKAGKWVNLKKTGELD